MAVLLRRRPSLPLISILRRAKWSDGRPARPTRLLPSSALPSSPLVVIVVVVFGICARGGRSGASDFLPVVLHGRRKLFDARQKCRDLPDVGFGERLVPCGHSRVADAVVNHVKDVPFGIVVRLENQVRWRRIERLFECGGLAVDAAMAESPIPQLRPP